jgi:hypothetical protein
MSDTITGTVAATADNTVHYYDARVEALEKRLTALEDDYDKLKVFSLEQIKNLINRMSH